MYKLKPAWYDRGMQTNDMDKAIDLLSTHVQGAKLERAMRELEAREAEGLNLGRPDQVAHSILEDLFDY